MHGYSRFGAAYWPAASHFVLLEIDACGNSLAGELICRICVGAVARLIEAFLELEDCHSSRYEIVGQTEPAAGTCCFCLATL